MKKKLFAIVDIETTGGNAKVDRITEIGIVTHDGERIIEQYETLVNPEIAIPDFIIKLTGITNEMVANAPHFYQIAKKVVEQTEGKVFVAHNVRFDYSFLKMEFERLGYNFSRPKLCTVRLSRKILPGLASYSLGNLIKKFNIQTVARHRALADAQATAELIQIILKVDHSDATIEQLINQGIKETSLPSDISLEKLHDLPESVGVYYFHDEHGNVVYVGKSINIKKRVMEHFSKPTKKADKLHRYVHDISFELTGSELAALLLESFEIKRLQPFVNKAQRQRQFPYTIQYFADEGGYTNFELIKSKTPKSEGYNIAGEYPQQKSAKSALLALTDRYQLCRRLSGIESKSGNCFYHQIQLCRGACVGKEPVAKYNERALLAIEQLDTELDGTFFIVDEGRHQGEKVIVLIEEGVYRGFGYVDSNLSGHLPAHWINEIKKYPANPEVHKIIRHYIAKKNIQIIPF